MKPKQQGQTISVQGIDMYYETHGVGKPLLLLHGFTRSGEGLQKYLKTTQNPINSSSLTYEAMEDRLFRSNQYLFHQSALDIFALLDHLKINECSAVGLAEEE